MRVDTADRRGRRDPVGEAAVFPASHYVSSTTRARAGGQASIEAELAERLAELEREGKLLEAQRLQMRTNYDLEMIREVGSCNGIENYSRHFDGRAPGEAPYTLLDYFPSDFVVIIDESHVTVPQIGGDVRGRPVAQGDAGRATASGCRRPATTVR